MGEWEYNNWFCLEVVICFQEGQHWNMNLKCSIGITNSWNYDIVVLLTNSSTIFQIWLKFAYVHWFWCLNDLPLLNDPYSNCWGVNVKSSETVVANFLSPAPQATRSGGDPLINISHLFFSDLYFFHTIMLHCDESHPLFIAIHCTLWMTFCVVFKIKKSKNKSQGCWGSVSWLLGEGQHLPWLLWPAH